MAATAAASKASSRGGGSDGGEAGGGGGKLALALLAGVVGFLLLVLMPMFLFFSSASLSSCDTEPLGGVPVKGERKPDPEDLPPLEIAKRAYAVGVDMRLGKREILTAFATIMVESGGGVTMRNPHVAVDHSSVGAYQQQAFLPWTARERLNVAAASRTFYEQLKIYDRGQPIGELAADIQRPAAQYRGRYALAVPGARRFYARVEGEGGAGSGPAGEDAINLGGCSEGGGGAVDLQSAQTLHQPRAYKTLPAKFSTPGFGSAQVDARIYDNVIWALSHYKMTVNAARASGHATHGDGTALDLQPADASTIKNWKRSTERFARDLGWNAGCAASGTAPVCPLVPAIQFVGYNGYDANHGDPDHSSLAHLHVSWANSCYGCGGGALVEPREWVKVFAPAEPKSGGKGKGKDKGGERRRSQRRAGDRQRRARR